MKHLEIIVWSDYACPFCYIGERNLKTAIRSLGIEDTCSLEMRSFELSPDAPDRIQGDVAELIARKYGFSVEEARYQIERIDEMGRQAGINLNYAGTHYSGTFDAHRLTKYAQAECSEVQADLLIERLFRAIFTEGEILADHDTLLRLAEDAGLDRDKVQKILETDRFADEVRKDEQQAEILNIHAVPYFVIDQKYAIPGALSADEMKNVLLRILSAEKDATGKKTYNPFDTDRKVCGPDGCV